MAPPTKNQLTSQVRNEKAESRKLRIALTAAEEEIAAVKAELATIKADREASATSTARYTELADTLAKANHRAHVLENSVAVRTEERDNAIAATAKANLHLQEFGVAISKLENSLVGRTNELTTERNRANDAVAKLAELEASFTAFSARAKADADALFHAKALAASQAARVVEAETRSTAATDSLRASNAWIETLRATIASDAAMLQNANNMIDTLETQVKIDKVSLEHLEERLQRLEKLSEEAEVRASTAEGRLRGAESWIEILQANAQTDSKALETAHADLTRLEASISAGAAEISDLRRQVGELESVVEATEEELEDSCAAADTLKHTVAELQAHASELVELLQRRTSRVGTPRSGTPRPATPTSFVRGTTPRPATPTFSTPRRFATLPIYSPESVSAERPVSTLTGLPTPPTHSNDKFADTTNSLDAVLKEAGVVTPPSKLQKELPLGSPVRIKAGLPKAAPATVLFAEASPKAASPAAVASIPSAPKSASPAPVTTKTVSTSAPATKSVPVPAPAPVSSVAVGCECCSLPASASSKGKNSAAPTKEKPRPATTTKSVLAAPAKVDPKAPRKGCGMCCRDSTKPVAAK